MTTTETRLSNIDDRRKHGTKLIGSTCGNAILKEEDVVKIRSSLEPAFRLAKIYGTDPSNISHIKSRHTWRHV